MSEDTTNDGLSHVTHVYYEIGGELLSKPNALAQIIEAKGTGGVLIFCNTPSDTDLVEVLLKKRGISAKKLIGNVPQSKLEKTLEALHNGEVTALVVTDIAARGLDIDDFTTIIHYTAPSDGDTYAHRINKAGPFNNLKTVATLIGPLDITNFHYVKKSLGVEFVIKELPTAEELAASKVERLSSCAELKKSVEDPKYAALAASITARKDAQSIVAYLLQNTLEVLPALQVTAERNEEQEMDDDDDDMGQNDRFNRRDDRRGDDRNQRRNDRSGNERRGKRYDDDSDEGSEEQRQRPQRVNLPPIKDARMYIGMGTKEGLTQDKLISLLNEAGLSEIPVKRSIFRRGYSFFDIPEEKADEVITALSDRESVSGGPLFIRKATIISTAQQAPAEEAVASEDEGSEEQLEASW